MCHRILSRLSASIALACAVILAGGAGPAEGGCLSDGGYGFILVKDPYTGYIEVVHPDCTKDTSQEIYAFSLAPLGFTSAGTATIAPGCGDPGTHTTNPLTTFPPQDMDGIPGSEGPYTFHALSLRDIGTYDYLFQGMSWDGYDVLPMTSDVMSFYVDNYPPEANPSAGGDHYVGDTVLLIANANDPDWGSLTYDWQILSKPASSPGSISNATSSTAQIVLASKHDIGNWEIRLRVADDECEQITETVGFEVLNRAPEVWISGATDIEALTDIVLTANPEQDADGETVTWSWDVVSAPAASSHAPQNGISTDRTIAIPTGPDEIGEFQVRVTGTDEHDASDSATVTVTVNAIPPEIDLVGLQEIDVGDPIDLETLIVLDAYGDPFSSFDWDVLQVPASAGVPLGTIGTSSSLFIPTTAADAGTWRFKLTVTDQVGEIAEGEIDVLVDALPTASIDGPDQTGSITLGLTLDGSGSVDPDTPGGPPDYEHLSDGPVTVSPGIVRWSWNVLEVPPEHYGEYFAGPVADVFGVNGSGPSLQFGAFDLVAGDWLFELEIEDGEGNIDSATHWVQVIEEGLPPFAILSPPSYHVLTSEGLTQSFIGISGAASFDLDNLLTSDMSSGLGIESYEWFWAGVPLGCATPPPLPAGTSSPEFLMFSPGTLIPGPCQGVYQPGLTVTDDDVPTPRSSSNTGLVLIGNCAGALCIDHPTNAAPEYVKFSDQTNILIYYHLNSVLYDAAAYATGLRLKLQIFKTMTPGPPVYDRAWDVDLLPSEKGGPLVIHWSGFDNANRRPEPGLYDVTLQLVDPSGTPTADAATEIAAIHIQTLGIEAAPTADVLFNLNGAEELTDSLTIPYAVTGTQPGEVGYDEMILRVYEFGSSALVHEETITGPLTGAVDWDGKIGSGVRINPGAYEIELEIFELGASLAVSERHEFNAYRIDAELAGIADADELDPGAILLVTDTIGLTVTVEADFSRLSGDVSIDVIEEEGTLSADDGSVPLALDDGITLPLSSFSSPQSYTLTAIERGASGKTVLEASLTPDAGQVSNKVARDRVGVTVAEAELRVAASDPARQDTDGVFLRGARTPPTLTAANFAELRHRMQPISLSVGPKIPSSSVSLSLVSGSTANLELFEAGSAAVPVPLPQTWGAADFTDGELEVELLAYGKAFGDAKLKLEYKDGATVVDSRELLVRVRHLPGLVGEVITPAQFPFVRPLATQNEGMPVTVALDPARHNELHGRPVAIYVVAHKTPAQWAADPSLIDVTGGPQTVTVSAGSVADNAHVVWASAAPGVYDVVVDMGNAPEDPADFATDGQLDPGDLLDQGGGQAGLAVYGPFEAFGPIASATAEYGMGAAPVRVSVPHGYDGLNEPPSGFDFRLRGRVVHPVPMPASAPVVMIAHGNHTPLEVTPLATGITVTVDSDMTNDENFRGHTWLQTWLASHGFVSISIDLDEMVGDPELVVPRFHPMGHGIRVRSWVLLKNLEFALTDPGFIGGAVSGNLDASRLYMIGHSRGGEAVLQALDMIKSAANHPPGGTLDAAVTGATVKGIVSLAPMSSSLEAGNLAAHDVPFLLLYGTADGDVHGAAPVAMPFRHYDRSQDERFAIVIEGANHNHWNDSWTTSEASHGFTWGGAMGDLSNLTVVPLATPVGASLITRAQQKAAATGYIGAFLKLVHEGDGAARAYLSEPPARLRPLGLDAALQLHSQSRHLPAAPHAVIDDFESNFGNAVSSSGGAVDHATVAGISEGLLQDRALGVAAQPEDRFFQETRGTVFNWSAAAAYAQEVPAAERDLRGATAISLRVAQQAHHPTTLALGADLSFELELEDGAGGTSRISSTVLDVVQDIYPSERRGTDTTSGIFKTFRFPVHAFETDGQALDLGDIRQIRLRFADGAHSGQGRVAVDDLEIVR